MSHTERAILQTILYSSLFSFPLKKKEIWLFLKNTKPLGRKDFIEALSLLIHKKILFSDGTYYCLSSQKKSISIRQRRRQISEKKMQTALWISRIIGFIPTVHFVGISGSLALKNAAENDDIDFFIIVRKNTLWTTRICLLIALTFLGKRRRRSTKNEKNLICINLLLDTSAMRVSQKRQTVYTAHEIAQLLPLINKNNTFEKFLAENNWMETYMPHTRFKKIQNNYKKNVFFDSIVTFFFANRVSVSLLKLLQLSYMKPHITTEIVTDNFMAFHPQDAMPKIMKKYHFLKKQYLA